MATQGKGPRNFVGKLGPRLRARGAAVRGSSARTRRPNRAAAATGYQPSAGGGSGTRSTSTPLLSTPRVRNSPKTGRPGNSRRASIPAGLTTPGTARD